MSLTLKNTNSLECFDVTNYEEAKKSQSNWIWKQLELINIQEAVEVWLWTLSERTRSNYKSGLRRLAELGLFDSLMTLQTFALVNHEVIVDQIKSVSHWSECTRQARAAGYISFTGFLHRRSRGLIPKALANREGLGKTFFKVYDKVKTAAMSQSQWTGFLEALEEISPRECLIAKLMLQGGKRISEVLSLQIEQIRWDRRKIVFEQSKARGMKKTTVITFPQTVIDKLKQYVNERERRVFVTRTGKPVMVNRVAHMFKKAGKKSGVPFKITPHVLRASTVTYLKQQGFQDSDIMKVTGHASAVMVNAYDKTAQEYNATEKVQLVT
ncbi:tyrosine-type recombinase/integrase [Simkania negevensis]|nr:site-specific integrase [Simkania negevensis]